MQCCRPLCLVAEPFAAAAVNSFSKKQAHASFVQIEIAKSTQRHLPCQRGCFGCACRIWPGTTLCQVYLKSVATSTTMPYSGQPRCWYPLARSRHARRCLTRTKNHQRSSAKASTLTYVAAYRDPSPSHRTPSVLTVMCGTVRQIPLQNSGSDLCGVGIRYNLPPVLPWSQRYRRCASTASCEVCVIPAHRRSTWRYSASWMPGCGESFGGGCLRTHDLCTLWAAFHAFVYACDHEVCSVFASYLAARVTMSIAPLEKAHVDYVYTPRHVMSQFPPSVSFVGRPPFVASNAVVICRDLSCVPQPLSPLYGRTCTIQFELVVTMCPSHVRTDA